MAKQKCGSCQFFQEAGLAGSGWCHHPQRKVSSGVLIMVRRNELACRDEWSRSLWQPAGAAHTKGDVSFQRPASTGPLPPTQPEYLHAILNKESISTNPADGEDVLLSEARIVSETHEPWVPSELPFPTGNFDPRTAIFRAREAYRDRVRAKAVADRQSDGAEATSNEGLTAESFDPQGATSENLIKATAELAKFSTGEDPDESCESEVQLSDRQSGADSSGLNQHVHTVVERGEQLPEELFQPLPDESPIRQVELERRPTTTPNVEPNLAVAAEHARDKASPPGLVQVEVEGEPLPDWFRTDLPRICRSCRDYRPAADGQRGWCANEWAFTHRRLVHEDDSVPCQSASGGWWVPVDDVWLVAADVSSHGRPTPLLDRLTGKVVPQRRRS